MPNYSENDVLAAIDNGVSVRKASREYGVPRTTLHDRIIGIRPKSIAHQHTQKLSTVQEDTLARPLESRNSWESAGLTAFCDDIRLFGL
ncbi:hypothetical protein F4824DRAFT_475993 [Ustulina deusta]|nr:hypothetical protein F4824DRAFT_475993 [Ustulina deusta]